MITYMTILFRPRDSCFARAHTPAPAPILVLSNRKHLPTVDKGGAFSPRQSELDTQATSVHPGDPIVHGH